MVRVAGSKDRVKGINARILARDYLRGRFSQAYIYSSGMGPSLA